MLTEKRIQVYFPERDYKALKQRARAEGKPIAQILREAAAQYLKKDPRAILQEGYKNLLDGAGLCSDDRGDASSEHDKYLGESRW